MYVLNYVYIYICVYTYAYIYEYTCIHTYICVYVYIHISASELQTICMHECIQLHFAYTYVHNHIHAYMNMYVYTHINVYVRVYTDERIRVAERDMSDAVHSTTKSPAVC